VTTKGKTGKPDRDRINVGGEKSADLQEIANDLGRHQSSSTIRVS
jgi:hypothetical protein